MQASGGIGFAGSGLSREGRLVRRRERTLKRRCYSGDVSSYERGGRL